MANATTAAGQASKTLKMMLKTDDVTYLHAVEKLGELTVLAEQLLTPANISMGVSALLVLSGVAHAIPGPTLKMQAKMLGMPAWFIMCAGFLMIFSGALYHAKYVEGIYAVSLCMGGALITAAKIPDPMHRPGGMIFSVLTLAATLWSHCQCAISFHSMTPQGLRVDTPFHVACKASELTPQVSGICAVAFVAGMLGRVFVPGNVRLAKLFGSEEAVKKEKKDDSAAKVSDPLKKDPLKIPVATKVPDNTKDAGKTGARKRVDSPANRAKATGMF